jgi:hypothetical protein
MKPFMAIALALCAVSAAWLAAQTSKPTQPSKPTQDDAILKADRALAAAYAQGDTATIKKMLDEEFTWIDSDGIMYERADTFRANLKPLVPMTAETQITEHKYGKVVWIQDNIGHKFAAHFWVQRPEGWRLLHVNEIEARPAEPGDSRPTFTIPCINPCKELPWKPLSPSEKAAIEGWQDQESGTGRRLMHMGDKVWTITSNTMVPQQTVPSKEPTKVDPPTAEHPFISTTPAIWVRTWDFGDAVVAVMLQPTWGGKPYWSSRVFANHNGFWKMEESYHTTIEAAPRMQYVPSTEQSSKAEN